MKRKFSTARQLFPDLVPAGSTGVMNQTTAAVAKNSIRDSLINQFNHSTYSAAMSNGQAAVKIQPMETRYLQTAENRNPQFDISNGAGADKTVIIGSALALNGSYAYYGQSPSACDSAGMTDQYGANLLAVQGFSTLGNHNNVFITTLQVISTDLTQVNQPWKYFDISYDSTVNQIVGNTTSTYSRYDNDNQISTLAGAWALGIQNGLSIVSKKDKDMTVTLTLALAASTKMFKMVA